MLYFTKKEDIHETTKDKSKYYIRYRCHCKRKVLAESDDRSFSQYVNLVLKEHITSQSHKFDSKI